jgi:hypothetical protein
MEQPRANARRAMEFPLPGVAETLSRRTGIPHAEAMRREVAFRRWFVVAAASPVIIGMGSAEIDAYWHVLLEFPDLYAKYSRAVAGTVVRHIEGVGGEVLDARSWVAYEAVWGVPPPAEYWRRPDAAAMARVRVKARRRSRQDDDGDDGDFDFSLDLSDGYSHDGCHRGGDGCDGGGHSHGGDSGGHGCGGHGCGGGCGGGH